MRNAILRLLVAVMCAGSAHAAEYVELTSTQLQLIQSLPTVEEVLAAVPPRADPLENAVLRAAALRELGDMAETLAPHPRRPEVHQAINRFHAAAHAMRIETLKSINGWGPGTAEESRRAAEQKLKALGQRLFANPVEGLNARRELFENVLSGDLLDYALDRHYAQALPYLSSESATELRMLAESRVRSLPEPWKSYASRVLHLPKAAWVALLVVWLLLGITFRTTPFRLPADDVWTLQRGCKRRRMAHSVTTVIQVREELQVVEHTNTPVNQYGRAVGPSSTSISTTRTKTLFVRDAAGREDTIRIVNMRFDVREGHRVLRVLDAKSRSYLFLYNFDLRRYLFLPGLATYVRMRPWIFIPPTVLATMLALQVSPDIDTHMLLIAPLGYLIFVRLVNWRRFRVFKKKMTPRLLEAAGTPQESNFIGNADFGIKSA